MTGMDSTVASLMCELSSHQEEIAELTKQLIAIPTENPPGAHYAVCLSLIERKCKDLGLCCERIEVPKEQHGTPYPRECLLATHGLGDRVLYFHGHYDVVPAFDNRQFEPHRVGQRLVGRGSADMKGGLAAMISAIQVLKAWGKALNGRIVLVVVPDEETGGRGGSQYLSKLGVLGRHGVGMLTAEPTSGVVWHASRGALSARVIVQGKAAHVGWHFQGLNAFEKMHVVVRELLELKVEIEQRKTDFPIEPEAARNSILLIGGRCEGGTNFNTVPAECSFTIDRRINPEEDVEEEKQRILEVVDRCRQHGASLQIEFVQEGASGASSETTLLAMKLAESVRETSGRPARFELCPGLLETRFYQQLNIPAYAYGPGLFSVAHGPEEWVGLEEITRCAAVYALTALRFLGSR
jgi:succinyl-diaminopimelate desuccinylase